jgi:translation initiation factor 2B subunit (eIF-2B alpha/beta/delta family)
MEPADDLQRLASDLSSSATTLLDTAYRLLRDACDRASPDAERMAVSVVRAQPSMGSMWNLAAAALAGRPALDRIYQRAARGPAAIARYVSVLAGDPATVRRVVTCSSSAAVASAIAALHAAHPIAVRCAESRPGCEGRALAASLAEIGVAVELVTDAAIATDLGEGDLVLVGADAVAPGWFVNKVGTGQLCAAASLACVPVYVLAGREKFLRPSLAEILPLRDGDAREVWSEPSRGVSVSNPLFERVPLDRVAGVVCDAGLLAGEMVGMACEPVVDASAADRLRRVVLSS